MFLVFSEESMGSVLSWSRSVFSVRGILRLQAEPCVIDHQLENAKNHNGGVSAFFRRRSHPRCLLHFFLKRMGGIRIGPFRAIEPVLFGIARRFRYWLL